jgi:hypothetical protein
MQSACDSKESHQTSTIEASQELVVPTNETATNTTIAEKTIHLSSLTDQQQPLSIANKRLILHNVNQSYILIHFFTPKSSKTLTYLTDLQKRHKEKIFIASVLLENDLDQEAFNAFKKSHSASHFISYSYNNALVYNLLLNTFKVTESTTLPLTILFKNGEYLMHYEGEVPIEMIQYDLNK